MNRYLDGMLTNVEIIQELLKLARDITVANAEGDAPVGQPAFKKCKYPPEGIADAVQTVMRQCEMWTDNVQM